MSNYVVTQAGGRLAAFAVGNVCFWHKADIATVLNDVRYRG
jgi:hypothetical protein